MRFKWLFFLCILSACQSNDPPRPAHADTILHDSLPAKDSLPQVAPKAARKISTLENQLREAGLVNVHELDSLIWVELKYSTTDNFMQVDVYGEFDQAYLQPDVAQRLVRVQDALTKKYPNYHLLIYDAVRPRSIQQRMWDTVKMPRNEKTKYLSNPERGSIHNYGAAVDLTIVDSLGVPLDMGTPYDFFGPEAHPVLERALLDSGKLNLRQVQHRQLLREVMRVGGFWGIQTEWWHFNACRREEAALKYTLVE